MRRLLGLDFEGQTFAQDWLIVDALDVPEPIDHVEFICDPRRPTPHMVAPGDRERWEFMLHPGEDAQAMERPESVRRLLAPVRVLPHVRGHHRRRVRGVAQRVVGAEPGSDFPVQNLPLGIFSLGPGERRPGVAIGDYILDLSAIADLLDEQWREDLAQPVLNAWLSRGPAAHRELLVRVMAGPWQSYLQRGNWRMTAIASPIARCGCTT